MIRKVPVEFLDDCGQPNGAFVDWLEPLIGHIEPTETLKGKPVKKLVLD